MNLNKVFLFGNLTRDPELRQIPSGQTVCQFSIATNRTYNDKAGQKQQQVEYHNIIAWGKQGETINQYLKKGGSILVEGRLQTQSWDDKTTGQKRYKTQIVVESFQFGPRPSGSNSAPATGKNETAGNQTPPAEQLETVQYPGDEEEIKPDDIPF